MVVGDIALLEPGEIVPCDGIFLSGHNVRCDESGATGESDAIRKLSYEECVAHSSHHHHTDLGASGGDTRSTSGQEEGAGKGAGGREALKHTDCFVVSGSKVLEGVGKYVVVAVGETSFNGRIMMSTCYDLTLSIFDC